MGNKSSKSSTKGGDIGHTERIMNGRRGIDKSERIHTSSERAKLALKCTAKSMIKSTSTKSLDSIVESKSSPILPPLKLTTTCPLIAEEVVKRISVSVETKDVILGELKSGSDDGLIHVQYAALTQRGYYPNNPHKENQDEYFLCPSKFASGEGDAFFAIFDGHGDKGHDCASFAQKKLHSYLAQNVKKERAAENCARLRELDVAGEPKPKNAFHPSSWPYLDVGQYERCCRTAHLQCNKAMHDDKKVSFDFRLHSLRFETYNNILTACHT